MQYNYSFEAASLLFMLLIFVHFMVVWQFPTEKTRVFRALLIVCIGESAFNILSSIGLANAGVVPQIVNEILAFVFFSFEGLSSLMIYKYMVVISELDQRQKKWAVSAAMIPAAFFFIFLLLTPFIGFYYYFQDGVYHQGRGANFGYFYIMLFFALNLVMSIARRKIINVREKYIIYLYTAAALIAVWVQYYHREILLTSLGNSVIVIMIYLSMQNPNDYLDTVTGIGNEAALELQLKDELMRDQEGTVIIIRIRQYQQMGMLFGAENCNMLMAELGQYFFHLGGKFHVFRSDADTFVVMTDKDRYQEMVKSVEWRFSEEWKIEENHILLDHTVMIMHYPKDFTTIPEFFGIRSYLSSVASGNAGKEPVIETDAQMIEGYYRQNQIEMILERALRERSIQVYYQPIYSLKEKRIVSLEALARLFDGELGYIPPAEFIPIAEKNGDIIRIGEIVLEECCKFLSKHVLSNMSLGIRSIQINISVAQCQTLGVTFSFLLSMALKEKDFDYGRVLAEKMGALAHTFEMGKYSECSTMLDVVYAEKNVEGTFQVVRQLLENVESIGDFSGSKLYRHLQFKKNARWNADELREKLLEGFRDETEFSYMKGYEPWEKLVSK